MHESVAKILTVLNANSYQNHFRHATNKSSQRSHTSVKDYVVCRPIRTSDTDSESRLLPTFNGDLLVQGYICDKMFMKIQSLSPEI